MGKMSLLLLFHLLLLAPFSRRRRDSWTKRLGLACFRGNFWKHESARQQISERIARNSGLGQPGCLQPATIRVTVSGLTHRHMRRRQRCLPPLGRRRRPILPAPLLPPPRAGASHPRVVIHPRLYSPCPVPLLIPGGRPRCRLCCRPPAPLACGRRPVAHDPSPRAARCTSLRVAVDG